MTTHCIKAFSLIFFAVVFEIAIIFRPILWYDLRVRAFLHLQFIRVLANSFKRTENSQSL